MYRYACRVFRTALLCGAAVPVHAELVPEWIARLPVGTALSAGISDAVTDASGVTYVTGINGPSGNTDIVTAAIGLDGALLWSHVFDGAAGWHDQSRAIALAPGGRVVVTGNTPGPGSFAQVLLLEYDASTGALLDTVQYSSAPFTSEHGALVAVDAAGNRYVAGGTVGDGADVLLIKLDPSGSVLWTQTWDGPAFGPFSQDVVKDMELDPDGNLVVLIHGVWFSNQPDYVVLEVSPTDGTTIWQANWGSNGGDYPRALTLDAAGDVFVTGTAIDFTDKYSTIKLDGSSGELQWQAFDSNGIDDSARAIALDGQGGVYVTGSVDSDGNQSNFNDDFYTVKRDAQSGALLWSHRYGQTCVGCLDVPSDVIVDPGGHVFVAGGSSSPPYAPSGVTITFVLDASTGLETERGVVSTVLGAGAGSGELSFGPSHELINAGQLYNATTGQIEMTVFEYASLVGAETYCTAGISAAGCSALVDAGGRASATAASGFMLVASGVEGERDGLFFFGANGRQANPWGNGSSFQCVVPPVKRAGLLSGSGTSGACDGSLAQDLNALWCPTCPKPAKNPGAGAVVQAQLWYRDPLNTSNRTTSLSDAVEFGVAP